MSWGLGGWRYITSNKLVASKLYFEYTFAPNDKFVRICTSQAAKPRPSIDPLFTLLNLIFHRQFYDYGYQLSPEMKKDFPSLEKKFETQKQTLYYAKREALLRRPSN